MRDVTNVAYLFRDRDVYWRGVDLAVVILKFCSEAPPEVRAQFEHLANRLGRSRDDMEAAE